MSNQQNGEQTAVDAGRQVSLPDRLRSEFRVRSWWPGMDSFDTARGETEPHPLAEEAASFIEQHPPMLSITKRLAMAVNLLRAAHANVAFDTDEDKVLQQRVLDQCAEVLGPYAEPVIQIASDKAYRAPASSKAADPSQNASSTLEPS